MNRRIIPLITIVIGIVWILIHYQDNFEVLLGGLICMGGFFITMCDVVCDLKEEIKKLKEKIKKLEGNA